MVVFGTRIRKWQSRPKVRTKVMKSVQLLKVSFFQSDILSKLVHYNKSCFKERKQAVGLPIKIILTPPSGLIPRSRGSRGVALCVYNYMPPLPHLGISIFLPDF